MRSLLCHRMLTARCPSAASDGPSEKPTFRSCILSLIHWLIQVSFCHQCYTDGSYHMLLSISIAHQLTVKTVSLAQHSACSLVMFSRNKMKTQATRIAGYTESNLIALSC